MKTSPPRSETVEEALSILESVYPQAEIALIFKNPLELLVATILSAQCTDVRVNKVTRALFQKYPTALSYASADPAELEEDIRSTGFFRNKARNIIGAARMILDQYGGEVPRSMEELVQLPGVGRKTANVVLGNVYGIPGMVVDTHVKRVSRRLGWTQSEDPVRIEEDLSRLIPREKWTTSSHLMIWHGRGTCKAVVPRCTACPLLHLCPRRGVTRSL